MGTFGTSIRNDFGVLESHVDQKRHTDCADLIRHLGLQAIKAADLPKTVFFNDNTHLATRYLPAPLGYTDDDPWRASQLNVIGAKSDSYLLQKTVETQLPQSKLIPSSDD